MKTLYQFIVRNESFDAALHEASERATRWLGMQELPPNSTTLIFERAEIDLIEVTMERDLKWTFYFRVMGPE